MAFFLSFIIKLIFMAKGQQNRDGNSSNNRNNEDSIGNQQRTTQTGAQNNRGQDVDADEDQFTEDLKQSGNRNSSNQNSGDASRH